MSFAGCNITDKIIYTFFLLGNSKITKSYSKFARVLRDITEVIAVKENIKSEQLSKVQNPTHELLSAA